MILVDTAIWIDHFHTAQPALVQALHDDAVGSHPLVIEELAMGSITRRDAVLSLLESLHGFPVLSHAEVLTLVERHRVWGRGLGVVDVHLLGAVLLASGGRLWTRDGNLRFACRYVGVPVVEDDR